jgi:hypothetical protein
MFTESFEKWRVGGEEVRENNGKVEWTKVKYTHSGHTLKNSFEHQFKH